MANNNLYLSHSSIQVFHTCKRRFKYKHIDRIKPKENLANKYLSFGQSVHTALAKYNLLTDETYRTVENLHKLLRKNWIRQGYESIEEERDFGLRALDMLSNYHSNPLDQGKKNLLVEEMIYLDIDGKFTLCGKLDKSYLRNDDSIETTDYKTGKNIEAIDTLQMPIYLLLTKSKLGCFPDTVSYYFLAHGEKITQDVNESYIKESIDFLWEISEEIISERKYPCSPSPYCSNNCEYFADCPEAKDSNLIIVNSLLEKDPSSLSNSLF
ncbi:RecB family exonuclease [Alkaliphilus hydrothermalis]|uniref:CRISPR/Cas system-associated exonuclease Cas4 (RecB family) n=1 Tax=Alkaliphilus hydrothermalis TaxID=1482730 RepID=A0ABS2NTN9_9FIRM|nr:PD-(D/E)XK nuclease family protein [Alkaliphilus hydrothermalis]MBM7616312.1 CRISPR/Cas system-associated exonuclease Cas4 (RecB family) [Alkaliphilus hydrothermalis]